MARIFIYAMNYSPEVAGVGRYAGEIGDYLAATGHEVAVLMTIPHYRSWKVSPPCRNGRCLRKTKGGARIIRCPLILRDRMGGVWRIIAPLSSALYGGAAALVVAIGASRVALEAHTVPDVVIGVLIGAVSIAVFKALRVRPERLELSTRTVVRMSPFAVLCALCFLLLAGHWTAEPFIDAIAKWIGADVHLCR